MSEADASSEAVEEAAPRPAEKRGLVSVVREIRRPKVATMLGLGFSSGLPFLLTGNTLAYWLREEGATLTAIGLISWVGFAYALKFLWSPLLDRLNAPAAGRLLGRRRGWMLIAQCVIAAGLAGMAAFGSSGGLPWLTGLALLVAFASASQDIVIDAWRIEIADDSDELGLLSAAYQLGYRAAMLVTDALILILADHFGWRLSYGAMAVLMVIGLGATWFAVEPARADEALEKRSETAPFASLRGIYDAIAGPFSAFFRSHGALALLMLITIALYMAPDFMMGPMANPFYHDLGLSKDVVGSVRGSVGLAGTIAGIAAGGIAAVRFGFWRTLIIGEIVEAVSIASYSLLALHGPDVRLFGFVMAFSNFGISMAGVSLVSYMSSLTNLGYTATQYALLSSTYAVVGKFLKGFSGAMVEWLAQGSTLMNAYAVFFALCAAIGVPAVALCIVLMRSQQRRGQTAAAERRLSRAREDRIRESRARDPNSAVP